MGSLLDPGAATARSPGHVAPRLQRCGARPARLCRYPLIDCATASSLTTAECARSLFLFLSPLHLSQITRLGHWASRRLGGGFTFFARVDLTALFAFDTGHRHTEDDHCITKKRYSAEVTSAQYCRALSEEAASRISELAWRENAHVCHITTYASRSHEQCDTRGSFSATCDETHAMLICFGKFSHDRLTRLRV